MKNTMLGILFVFIKSFRLFLESYKNMFVSVFDTNLSRKERKFAAYSITAFVLNALFIVPNLIAAIFYSLVFSTHSWLRQKEC